MTSSEAGRPPDSSDPTPVVVLSCTTGDVARYFVWLGTTGFGGPVALAGAMQRDLVEKKVPPPTKVRAPSSSRSLTRLSRSITQSLG